MNINTAERPVERVTLSQMLAGALRALADHIHAADVPPSPERVAREQLVAARLALLQADSESERWTHTCAMLRERVARLEQVS